MQLFERRHGDALIFKVYGRLHQKTARPLGEELARRVAAGERHIILDFSELESMAAAGLQVVLQAARHLRGQGGRLTLCGCRNRVHHVIHASGCHEEFNAHQSLEEVCAKL